MSETKKESSKETTGTVEETITPETPETIQAEVETEIKVEMVEKSTYVRLYSEFENFKRRTQKEKEDYTKTAIQKVVVDILPSLDNFERAIATTGELEKGIQLIFDNLKKTLEKYGVKEVDAKGLVFDADTMEALTQIPSGDEMKGKVVDVIEKGYELNGKIVRFAKVVVGA